MGEDEERNERGIASGDGAASTAQADELERTIESGEAPHRRRPVFVVAAAMLGLIAIVGTGLVLARRSPASPDQQLASGTPADVAAYLAQSSGKSLEANTFTYSVRLQVSGQERDMAAYLACVQGTQSGEYKAAVDLEREVTETIDPSTGAPMAIGTIDFDAVSASHIPGAAIAQPWVSYDRFDRLMGAAMANPTLGLRMSSVGLVAPVDPEGMLSDIRAAATSVRDAGNEDIDGVATQHLVIEFDATKIKEPTGDRSMSSEELARRRGHAPTATSPSTSSGSVGPADVWIGREDGLIRRIRGTFTYRDPSDRETTIDMTIDFSGYGTPLPVEPPTLEQTVPFASLPATALLGDAKQTSTCGAQMPGGTASIAPSPATLECIQQVARESMAGKTVAEYLRESAAAYLPDNDSPVIPALGGSDEMHCYTGLPPTTTVPGTPMPPCPTIADPENPTVTMVLPSVNGPCLRPPK